MRSKANAKTGNTLRFVLSGGAPLPDDVLDGLQDRLGVPVIEHYGSSEGMQICSNVLTPGGTKRTTVGKPWPGTIRVVADDGGQVPAGERGEIWVGGPTVVSEYLNAHELNPTCFAEGWFKSGDIGSLDAEGFLTVHGRKDDVINRGGEKISPAEIDAALTRHPAIAEAAAFAVSHPRLGEDVAAAVVLRHGMKASPIELRRHLQQELAAYKVPRRILIRDQLPKGQTGKVLRRRLAQSWEEQMPADAPAESTSDGCALEVVLGELWAQLLSVGPFLSDDDFFENGGDSLLAMEMHAELERFTGRTLSSSIVFDAPTIGQLAQKLSEQESALPKSLVQLHPNGRRAPLFFIHGDWPISTLVKVAKALGTDQPVFVADRPGRDHEHVARSIETMATDRLPLILQAQPEGPYRLCGYCIGAIVAFEVARMLVAAGKKVELVVMIDPPGINAFKSAQLLFSIMRCARLVAGARVQRVMARAFLTCSDLQKFCNISWARRRAAIINKFRRLAGGPPSGSASDRFIAQWLVRYAAVLSNYVPKPLAVPIVHFSVDFGGEAWRRLSSDLEIIKSGGHHRQLEFEHIAHELKPRLQPTPVK